MKHLYTIILTCITAAMMMAFPMQAQGQTSAPEDPNAVATAVALSPEQIAHISDDMTNYISEIMSLEEHIANATSADIKDLESRLQAIDVRWQAYTQIEQVEITASPVLMDLLSKYKLRYIATSDSLTAQKGRLDAVATFNKAQAVISQSIAKYQNLYSQAQRYSLVPQTASLLEDVKAQEVLLSAQVTDSYQKAVAASQLSESLKAKIPALQQEYIKITKLSEKIKATAYKSWIERIKDYVLTFAGVAIILIFLNFVVTKIKAIKQAKQMAKKYSDMLHMNDDYPTI